MWLAQSAVWMEAYSMKKRKRGILRIGAQGLLVGLLFAASAVAQTVSSSITGIVKDSSGALVPGVQVTVTDKSTNVSVTTQTNKDGIYQVSFLTSSHYQVTFTKQGFKTDMEADVLLVSNQAAHVDATLEVGSTTQSVTVTATPPLLDKETPMIGATVSSDDLVKYPEVIGSHGPTELVMAKIFAGMSGSSPSYSNPNDFSVGGGRTDTVPYIIDGLPSNMAVDNTYGFVPTPDSTQELQVLITPYSAQYGQTGGGAILTTTKSGTDNLHGALFEYHNDQNLNAIDFFTVHPAPTPEDIFNYFGGNAGGPVYIPHIWNGRNRRTFFFTDWEDTLNYKPSQLNTTVPTAMERQGNFSGPEPNNTATTPTIYNPATTVVTGSTYSRTAFAGNIITTPEDPVAAKIMTYYPMPNCAFDTYDYCLYAVAYHSYLYNTDRVDQEIGDYDRLWFRFARDGPWTNQTPYINNAANPSATNGWRDYHEEATWVHIFSPAITNELRVAQVEEDNFTLPNAQNVASLGLANVPPSEFPGIGVTGLYSIGGESPSTSIDRFQIVNDALEWQKGRHNLHLGGEFIHYLYNPYNPGLLTGSYSFTGVYTDSTSGGKATGGFGPADLYLGQVNSASLSTDNYEFRYRLNYYALYAQDDFKLSSRLTLNFGVRWEVDGPTSEVNNQLFSMNPALTDPTTGKRGAIEYAGLNGAPMHFVPYDYRGILPRGGFAYSLAKDTVIRGGYGMFQLPSIGFVPTAQGSGQTSEFSRSCSFTGTSTTPAFALQTGVGNCAFNVNSAGQPNIPSSLTSPSQNVIDFQQQGTIPYVQEWSVSLQHHFGQGWVGEIDWIGNKGTHLPVTLAANQIPYTSTACCDALSTTASQALRPFPQWKNVNYFTYGGLSNYNGLIVQMQHYWTKGLSTLVNFTWAKTMNDVDASARSDAVSNQNTYDTAAQYGVAMIDVPKRFALSYVWDVPIGSGGKLVQSVPVVSQILGHWEFSGVTQFQVGYPYNVSQTNVMGLYNGAQYCSRSGEALHFTTPTVAQWFNPAAFVPTPINTFGDCARASLFGPGENNWDISLSKTVPVRERYRVQIRADFYNAFNHVQFDNLNTSCTTLIDSGSGCGGAFGAATGDIGARTIQLDARVSF